MNINLNTDSKTLEACLKTVNNFGFTVYHNICAGKQSVVPWGTTDWVLNILGIFFFLAVGLILVLIAIYTLHLVIISIIQK